MKKSESDKAHIEELLTQLEAGTERLEQMDKRVKASEQEAMAERVVPVDRSRSGRSRTLAKGGL